MFHEHLYEIRFRESKCLNETRKTFYLTSIIDETNINGNVLNTCGIFEFNALDTTRSNDYVEHSRNLNLHV